MKKKLKIFLVVGLLLFAIFSLSACGNPYHAKFITSGTTFQEEFLADNITYGAGLPEGGGYAEDESLPKERTHIIKTQSRLEEVFSEFPEIDFEKKMVIVNGFTTAANLNHPHKISKIILNGTNLRIEYGTPSSHGIHPPDASRPLTKWVIIIMDKLEIETAEIVYIGEVKSIF